MQCREVLACKFGRLALTIDDTMSHTVKPEDSLQVLSLCVDLQGSSWARTGTPGISMLAVISACTGLARLWVSCQPSPGIVLVVYTGSATHRFFAVGDACAQFADQIPAHCQQALAPATRLGAASSGQLTAGPVPATDARGQASEPVGSARQVLVAAKPRAASACGNGTLSSALSVLMCRLAKWDTVYKHMTGTVMTLVGTPPALAAQMAMMNAVFSAAKLAMPVHFISPAPTASQAKEPATVAGMALLQQAARAGNGHAHQLASEQQAALPHALISIAWSGMPGMQALRPAEFSVHRDSVVDGRTACFESGQPISVGYVCSLCLAVWSRRHAQCPACGGKPAGGASAPADTTPAR